MKFKEIAELSSDELLTKKRDLRQESLHLRLQQQSGQQNSRAGCGFCAGKWLGWNDSAGVTKSKQNKLMAQQTINKANGSNFGFKPRCAQDTNRRGDFGGMNKTIVVPVTRVPHAKFGKIVKQMREFYAHDEQNKAKTGDTVRIMETRPLSKLKRWRLVEIVQK
jgi:small subunit ribosomal protein S17